MDPVIVLAYVSDCPKIKFLEGSMTLKAIVHEIRIQNQVIFLDPPIEYARLTWVKQLHDWLGEESFVIYFQCSSLIFVSRHHLSIASDTKFSV